MVHFWKFFPDILSHATKGSFGLSGQEVKSVKNLCFFLAYFVVGLKFP